LYGTTTGGTTDGWGNVFKIGQDGTESVLFPFNGAGDGGTPYSGLIADPQGNLYGTTVLGGIKEHIYCTSGCGAVYELAPNGTEKVLHAFVYHAGADGAFPYGGLTRDNQGDLYGTSTGNKLDAGDGKIFKVAKDGTYTLLFSFIPMMTLME